MPQKDSTQPFAIRFVGGYHAVKQCFDADHARSRAAEDHPDMVVESVVCLDDKPTGWYRKN